VVRLHRWPELLRINMFGFHTFLQYPIAAVSQLIQDTYFNRTSLLLQGDGVNGAQNNTFIDSSANALVVTRTGTPTQGSFSPFSQSGWSGLFNGSTDYLSVQDNVALQLPADFTIEFWFNQTTSTLAKIFTKGPGIQIFSSAGLMNVALSASNSTTYFFISAFGPTITLGTWHHIALVRSGNAYTAYFDGVGTTLGSAGVSPSTGTNAVNIGCYSTNAYFLNGGMSNVRVVKGSAVYTSNFVPSKSPLTAIAGTSLLTLQDNRFKDNSVNNFQVTPGGTPKIQASSPFAPSIPYSPSVVGGSGYFNGNWVQTPNTSNFDLSGSANFTISAWVYNTGSGTRRGICGARVNGAVTGWCLYIREDNTLYMGSAIVGNAYADRQLNAIVIQPNTWVHIALVKTSTGYKGYVNGVGGTLLALTTGLDYQSTQPFTVGALASGGEYPYLGYISDFSFIKGTGLYTSDFIAPTAPLTAVTNTTLLLNFTNAGIVDGTAKNDILQVTSATTISTATKKFGTGSIAFNGSANGGLVVQPSTQTSFIGDFTVEFWAMLTNSSGGTFDVIGNYVSSTPADWLVSFTSGVVKYFPSGAGTTITSTPVSINTWYHVAIVRSGSTCSLYVNGVSQGTPASFGGILGSAIAPIYVGSRNNTNYGFQGNVDNLRITNGIARYTANFAPPIGPLPSQ
jgi:hypothetical protein